jgi:hypothetical protein
MPRFTYHKHRANLWEDLDLSDLVNAMSEFLLGSGFGEPADGDNQASTDDLKDAIINALEQKGLARSLAMKQKLLPPGHPRVSLPVANFRCQFGRARWTSIEYKRYGVDLPSPTVLTTV